MISKKVAGEQIGRVAGLKGFPREEREAINELILAIQEARSEYQAKNIVDVFVRGIETMPCPAPADIRRLIFEANRREEPGISQEERKRLEASLCPHCQSNGFMDRNGYFERCPECVNGRELDQTLLDMMNTPPTKKPRSEGLRNTVRLNQILSR